MEDTQTVLERIRELNKKKKKLMSRIRKSKKAQVKARIEKRKITEEIQSLRGKKNIFAGMPPKEAAKFVKDRIESVSPNEIFPKNLEREFDKVDMSDTGDRNTKVLDLGSISGKASKKEKAAHVDDDEHDTVSVSSSDEGSVIVNDEYIEEQDFGVIDLSDQ